MAKSNAFAAILSDPLVRRSTTLLWVRDIDEALLSALEYCMLKCVDVRAVTIRGRDTARLREDWKDLAPGVPLVVLEPADPHPIRGLAERLRTYGSCHVTIVVAEDDATQAPTIHEAVRDCPHVDVVGFRLYPADADSRSRGAPMRAPLGLTLAGDGP